jgi:hypothetical protein
LRLVEFVISAKARPSAGAGSAVFASGYPILRAVNHTTGDIFDTAAGKPTFEITVKFRDPADQISVYCQRAKASLPRVQKGPNAFLLSAANPQGSATLALEWDALSLHLTVPIITASLADPTPSFSVAAPNVDLLWWQISADRSFAFVPPNFDAVASPAEKITFDPLTSTFFHPDQPYFFRIKGRRDGVWSNWSTPLEFRVEKPAQPAPVKTTVAIERLRLNWPAAGEGCEYLVFGSNRLDFLPEPFAAEEIVTLRNQGVEQSRPNKNLVAVVTQPEIELTPAFRFYRVIARRNGVLSVPSDLIHTPVALAAKLPPALVLQDRWHRAADPKNPGAETDEHLATEMPLP